MLKRSCQTSTIYFTITPKKCGFSDQINQFSVLYKLGMILGYKYVHTPFYSQRSSTQIYNFLGFNDYFLLKIDDFKKEDFECIYLRIGNLFLLKSNIDSLEKIQNKIHEFVSKRNSRSDKIIVYFEFARPRPRSLLSKAIKSINSYFYHKFNINYLINSELPYFPDGLNLKSIYLNTKNKNPLSQTKFSPGKIKLLVHIRQGDTSIIETPWKTYIPLWKQNKLTEFDSLDSHQFDKYIDVNDYHCFVREFISCFPVNTFSILISSDGYKRGFEKIEDKLRFSLNLTSQQIHQLKEAKESYDEKKFKVFEDLDNSCLMVGEKDDSLFHFVDSILTADIIVIGTQQKMIPKLITNYYDFDNPPIIIVLHKTAEPPSYENLNLTPRKAKIIPAHLGRFNFEEVITQVKEAISHRIQENKSHEREAI